MLNLGVYFIVIYSSSVFSGINRILRIANINLSRLGYFNFNFRQIVLHKSIPLRFINYKKNIKNINYTNRFIKKKI